MITADPGPREVSAKSKKHNTTRNTGRSHNRQQISNVPWESERGREEGKERRKAQEISPRSVHNRLYIRRGISPKALQKSSAEDI